MQRTLQVGQGKSKMDIPYRSATLATDVRPSLQWKLISAVFFFLAALVLAELWWHGTDQDSLRLVLRTTARTSALLFALGFAAPSLPRLRDYGDSLLISFAASQTLHLVAIIALVTIRHTQKALIDPPGLVAYTCVGIIVARIFGGSLTRYSRWWSNLEIVALYVFWLIITGAFAGLFPGIKLTGLHVFIVVVLVMSLLVRLNVARKKGKGWKRLEPKVLR